MIRPTSAILLCALPRVGSTLLGELLVSAGAGGAYREWFLYPERERLWRELGIGSHDDYFAHVLEHGTAPNGMFAAKLMWAQLDEFLLYARRSLDDVESGDRAVIEALLPQSRFVWLRRRDTVAQAISWVKAVQTGAWRWRSVYDGDGVPRYDFAKIDWGVHQFRTWDGCRARWFAAHAIEPVTVWYEELAADPPEVARRVLGRLELDGLLELPQSTLAKQADDVSSEWADRYLADCAR